jgi:GR25 family glycosyltransferase involved in LPS biosynthesis
VNAQPIPIYCLNLRRSVERRAAMEAEFRRVNWTVNFVPAVDGKQQLDLDVLRNEGVLSPDSWSITKPLSQAEVGTYLTHERVWRRILRKHQPYAIICEDDVLVANPPLDLRRLARKIPPDCDLFYLYYMNDAPGLTAPAFDVESDTRLARVGPYDIYQAWSCGGTQCYLMTANGAAKALTHCWPICHPVDGYLARLSFEGRMSTYAIHPRAVRDAGFPSTIS